MKKTLNYKFKGEKTQYINSTTIPPEGQTLKLGVNSNYDYNIGITYEGEEEDWVSISPSKDKSDDGYTYYDVSVMGLDNSVGEEELMYNDTKILNEWKPNIRQFYTYDESRDIYTIYTLRDKGGIWEAINNATYITLDDKIRCLFTVASDTKKDDEYTEELTFDEGKTKITTPYQDNLKRYTEVKDKNDHVTEYRLYDLRSDEGIWYAINNTANISLSEKIQALFDTRESKERGTVQLIVSGESVVNPYKEGEMSFYDISTSDAVTVYMSNLSNKGWNQINNGDATIENKLKNLFGIYQSSRLDFDRTQIDVSGSLPLCCYTYDNGKYTAYKTKSDIKTNNEWVNINNPSIDVKMDSVWEYQDINLKILDEESVHKSGEILDVSVMYYGYDTESNTNKIYRWKDDKIVDVINNPTLENKIAALYNVTYNQDSNEGYNYKLMTAGDKIINGMGVNSHCYIQNADGTYNLYSLKRYVNGNIWDLINDYQLGTTLSNGDCEKMLEIYGPEYDGYLPLSTYPVDEVVSKELLVENNQYYMISSNHKVLRLWKYPKVKDAVRIQKYEEFRFDDEKNIQNNISEDAKYYEFPIINNANHLSVYQLVGNIINMLFKEPSDLIDSGKLKDNIDEYVLSAVDNFNCTTNQEIVQYKLATLFAKSITVSSRPLGEELNTVINYNESDSINTDYKYNLRYYERTSNGCYIYTIKRWVDADSWAIINGLSAGDANIGNKKAILFNNTDNIDRLSLNNGKITNEWNGNVTYYYWYNDKTKKYELYTKKMVVNEACWNAIIGVDLSLDNKLKALFEIIPYQKIETNGNKITNNWVNSKQKYYHYDPTIEQYFLYKIRSDVNQTQWESIIKNNMSLKGKIGLLFDKDDHNVPQTQLKVEGDKITNGYGGSIYECYKIENNIFTRYVVRGGMTQELWDAVNNPTLFSDGTTTYIFKLLYSYLSITHNYTQIGQNDNILDSESTYYCDINDEFRLYKLKGGVNKDNWKNIIGLSPLDFKYAKLFDISKMTDVVGGMGYEELHTDEKGNITNSWKPNLTLYEVTPNGHIYLLYKLKRWVDEDMWKAINNPTLDNKIKGLFTTFKTNSIGCSDYEKLKTVGDSIKNRWYKDLKCYKREGNNNYTLYKIKDSIDNQEKWNIINQTFLEWQIDQLFDCIQEDGVLTIENDVILNTLSSNVGCYDYDPSSESCIVYKLKSNITTEEWEKQRNPILRYKVDNFFDKFNVGKLRIANTAIISNPWDKNTKYYYLNYDGKDTYYTKRPEINENDWNRITSMTLVDDKILKLFNAVTSDDKLIYYIPTDGEKITAPYEDKAEYLAKLSWEDTFKVYRVKNNMSQKKWTAINESTLENKIDALFTTKAVVQQMIVGENGTIANVWSDNMNFYRYNDEKKVLVYRLKPHITENLWDGITQLSDKGVDFKTKLHLLFNVVDNVEDINIYEKLSEENDKITTPFENARKCYTAINNEKGNLIRYKLYDLKPTIKSQADWDKINNATDKSLDEKIENLFGVMTTEDPTKPEEYNIELKFKIGSKIVNPYKSDLKLFIKHPDNNTTYYELKNDITHEDIWDVINDDTSMDKKIKALFFEDKELESYCKNEMIISPKGNTIQNEFQQGLKLYRFVDNTCYLYQLNENVNINEWNDINNSVFDLDWKLQQLFTDYSADETLENNRTCYINFDKVTSDEWNRINNIVYTIEDKIKELLKVTETVDVTKSAEYTTELTFNDEKTKITTPYNPNLKCYEEVKDNGKVVKYKLYTLNNWVNETVWNEINDFSLDTKLNELFYITNEGIEGVTYDNLNIRNDKVLNTYETALQCKDDSDSGSGCKYYHLPLLRIKMTQR